TANLFTDIPLDSAECENQLLQLTTHFTYFDGPSYSDHQGNEGPAGFPQVPTESSVSRASLLKLTARRERLSLRIQPHRSSTRGEIQIWRHLHAPGGVGIKGPIASSFEENVPNSCSGHVHALRS